MLQVLRVRGRRRRRRDGRAGPGPLALVGICSAPLTPAIPVHPRSQKTSRTHLASHGKRISRRHIPMHRRTELSLSLCPCACGLWANSVTCQFSWCVFGDTRAQGSAYGVLDNLAGWSLAIRTVRPRHTQKKTAGQGAMFQCSHVPIDTARQTKDTQNKAGAKKRGTVAYSPHQHECLG